MAENPAPAKPARDPQTVKAFVVEALAFYLSYHDKIADVDGDGKISSTIAERAAMEASALVTWQDLAERRRDHRILAQEVIGILEAAGVRVSVDSIKVLEAKIEELRTIPARVAYTDEELKLD